MIISDSKFNVDLTPDIINKYLSEIRSYGNNVIYYNIYNGKISFISNGTKPNFGIELGTFDIEENNLEYITNKIYDNYLKYITKITNLYLKDSLKITNKYHNDIITGKISINYFINDKNYELVGKQLIKKADLYGGIDEDVFPLLINLK